jgi:hypothetical protein
MRVCIVTHRSVHARAIAEKLGLLPSKYQYVYDVVQLYGLPRETRVVIENSHALSIHMKEIETVATERRMAVEYFNLDTDL